ncbi:hypothetical protein [Yersinia aleksiciae]|uniref:hypothetical protein n=1 Tax=Yersinia aleksiciae TaxID=263819 RepID=UPI00119E049D|nr:hypothetical protein [Yersinia aleksiciae]
MKEFINDDVHLFKLTLLWPDGHLINQMAQALIERNAELLSLREQRVALKQFIDDECFVIDPEDEEVCIRASYSSKYDELFTAAKPAED